MKFGLVDRQGYVPDMNYGSAGQELSCFVPSDYAFEQVSYDNGEGAVKVDGHVWRFFFTHEGIGAELMEGIVKLQEAQTFLNNVKEHIWGAKHQEVQVFISGVTPD